MSAQKRGAALVTGAARRIGRAIALHLAASGRDVALHASARSAGEAQSLAAALRESGVRAAVITGDLSQRDSATALIGEATAALGPLELLVNNASIFEPDSATRIEPSIWERHFSVNLRAPVELASQFVHALGEREGCIVNIIDQRVLRLTPRYFSYTLSKAALWTATQTMAQAFAPRVRINAVGPGPVLPNQNEGGEGFAHEAASVPLEHAVDPAEIAEAVLYLAQARSITGQMICVDAGQHIAWKTPDALF
ncbi:MAG: SDR family oxidoreductase [Alphaproteobacteria bacterium]|nr:SDR family oxidoreductase [Alphaproteobacteria bacterium]